MLAAAGASRLAFAQVKPASLDLPVKDRIAKVTVWAAPQPKAVVLFSHGGGSWPEQYETLAHWFVAQGYSVLAPLHTESMQIAEDKRATLQSGLGDRIADMATLAGYAAQAYPGLPLVAAGHSYGSLFALMLGGSLEYIAPVHNPAVKAVLCFSSPGAIQGLINPAAYTTLKAPLLMITGDKDTVPGFVADWHDHKLPFAGTPVKESYLLTVTGGEHKIAAGADTAQFAMVTGVAGDFLKRELFDANQAIALPAGAAATLESRL